VFLSLRLIEDDGAAVKLQDALEAAGISCFLCDPLAGDDLATDIAHAVDACELFVVLGTKHYGEQGDSRFSTRQELQLAIDRRKPIFLIKRCVGAFEFADPLTQMYLPTSMFHQEWLPHQKMPEMFYENLVGNIKAKLEGRADNQ
jgi:hypothetical protein